MIQYRQAIISITKAQSPGVYPGVPTVNILFRQPFNKLGLSFEFSFSKSYAVPFSDNQIKIENPSEKMVEALAYEYSEPLTRPLIEIYAGYSSTRITTGDMVSINRLRASLNQIYTGFPIFYSYDKFSAKYVLLIDCVDILRGTGERVNVSFKSQTPLTTVLQSLLQGKARFDLSGLLRSPRFPSVVLDNDVLYSDQLVLEDILPDLSEQYGFSYTIDPNGSITFKDDTIQDINAPQLKTISVVNGLIDFPNSKNWVDYDVKTLFGRPDIFFPGDDVTVFAKNLSSGKVAGKIVDATYTWGAEGAEIVYTVNSLGQFANPYPVVRI